MTDQRSDSRLASPNSHPDFQQSLSATSLMIPSEAAPEAFQAILVDDDELYREAISGELEFHGFAVSAFPTGEQMLAHLDSGASAEVIVLDWKLESGLGIALVPSVMQRYVSDKIEYRPLLELPDSAAVGLALAYMAQTESPAAARFRAAAVRACSA